MSTGCQLYITHLHNWDFTTAPLWADQHRKCSHQEEENYKWLTVEWKSVFPIKSLGPCQVLKVTFMCMADSTSSQPVLWLIPVGLCLKHPVMTRALWSGQTNHSFPFSAQLPGQGLSLEEPCHRGTGSPNRQSLAGVKSEIVFLETYFKCIFQHQLCWLILPAGCNFSLANSAIYLLRSYPKVVLYYFIVGSGSVSHDSTQPHETGRARMLSHLSKSHLSMPSQCNRFNCYQSQLTTAWLSERSQLLSIKKNKIKIPWVILVVFCCQNI